MSREERGVVGEEFQVKVQSPEYTASNAIIASARVDMHII